MNSKQIKLFSEKYLPEVIDFHGIKIYHTLKNGELVWLINNPLDLSYNTEIIEVFLVDEFIRPFSKFIGSENQLPTYRSILTNFRPKTSTYIGSKDKSKFDEILNDIRKMSHEIYRIDFRVKKYNIVGINEAINLEFTFSVSNVYKKMLTQGKRWLQKLDEDDKREFLVSLYSNNEFPFDLEDRFDTLLEEIVKIPTLFDNEYGYYNINYTFEDIYGNVY
jgi:hypothetical protein